MTSKNESSTGRRKSDNRKRCIHAVRNENDAESVSLKLAANHN